MRKYILVFIFCLLAVGCVNTKVFMGSYDSVKITVSSDRAQMTAENFPYETRLSGKKVEKKLVGKPTSVLEDETDNDGCETGDTQGKLHVTIVCSEEKRVKELSSIFGKDGFTIDTRFHGTYKSSIISKVTVYPKRKGIDDAEGDYHLIEFETKSGLSCGIHRVLVKDPLAFIFLPMNLSADAKEIKMFITPSEYIKDGDFMAKNKTVPIPVDVNFQILSTIISTARTPIKIIFTRIG